MATALMTSSPVPPGEGALLVSWEPVPRAEVYLVCRLAVPVGEGQGPALLAGGLDLLTQRFAVPCDVRAVCELPPEGFPHRLVLARLPGGAFASPEALVLARDAASPAPSLEDFGPPVASWAAGVRVGTPPLLGRGSQPRVQVPPLARTQVMETGSTARKPAGFIEGGLSVREGVLGGAPGPRALSPLEAYERVTRPRLVSGASLPDPRSALVPPPAVPAAAPGSTPPAAAEPPARLRWAIVASLSLLRDTAAARAALRTLRGFLKVALVGVQDRRALERRTEELGVPLDGLFALVGDAPSLPQALGCRAAEIVAFVTPGDSVPAGARVLEVEPSGFAQAAEDLVDTLQ